MAEARYIPWAEQQLGPGHPLDSQSKGIIYNVFKYFILELEKQQGVPVTHVNKAIRRTSEATKTSATTIRKICKEAEDAIKQIGVPIFPGKRRNGTKTVNNIDDIDKCLLRRTILDFYVQREMPTLDQILEVYKQKTGYSGCRESLRNVMLEIGFRGVLINKKKCMIERCETVSLRTKFLRQMQTFRNQEFRSVIYLGETEIRPKPPNGSSRLVILHAGSSNGFVPNAELIIHAQNEDDYQRQMNAAVFTKWFCEQLIPKIPPSSIIVMSNNMSCQSASIEKLPTEACKKQVIWEWLTVRGVNPGKESLKGELLDLVKQHKRDFANVCVAHEIAAYCGHQAIRIPPHHNDYNAIELLWRYIKTTVAMKGPLEMEELQHVLKEVLSTFTQKVWAESVWCVEQLRTADMERDIAADKFMDSITIFQLESDEDSE
ncbi:uncharacterized protein LOC135214712 [Macrobrachium nipponense]|uniref:uncharacterized protein LOC135214712 n=1 Tax=Macrobrachium nipponense TaxID=159736 RepID=UPI0030C7F5C1